MDGTRDVRRKERTGTESSLAFTGKFVGYPINKNDFTLALGVSGSYRTPQISTDEGAYNVARLKHMMKFEHLKKDSLILMLFQMFKI